MAPVFPLCNREREALGAVTCSSSMRALDYQLWLASGSESSAAELRDLSLFPALPCLRCDWQMGTLLRERGKLSQSRTVLQKVAASFGLKGASSSVSSVAPVGDEDGDVGPLLQQKTATTPSVRVGSVSARYNGQRATAAARAAWNLGLTLLDIALSGDPSRFLSATHMLRTAHLGLHQSAGPSHTDTLLVQRDLGVALLMASDPDVLREARERLRAACSGLSEIRGEEDEEALCAKGWLALAIARMNVRARRARVLESLSFLSDQTPLLIARAGAAPERSHGPCEAERPSLF